MSQRINFTIASVTFNMSQFALASSFTTGNILAGNDSTTDFDIKGTGSPTITVNGYLKFPTTSAAGIVNFGNTTNNFTVDLKGDLELTDANTLNFNPIMKFSGSNNQVITSSISRTLGGTGVSWTVDKDTQDKSVAFSNNITLNAPLTINKGTILGDLKLMKGLTLGASAVPFDANSTVSFLPASGIATYNIVTGGNSFGNLFFDPNYTTFTISSSTNNFEVKNDLTIQTTGYGGGVVNSSGSTNGVDVTVKGNMIMPNKTESGNTIVFGSATTANNFNVYLHKNLTIADDGDRLYANMNFVGDGPDPQTVNITTAAAVQSGGTWTVDKPSGTFTLATDSNPITRPLVLVDGMITGELKVAGNLEMKAKTETKEVQFGSGSKVTFVAPGYATQNITSNGNAIPEVNFNSGAYSTEMLIDNMHVSGNVTVATPSSANIYGNAGKDRKMTIDGDLSFTASPGQFLFGSYATPNYNFSVDLGGHLSINNPTLLLYANMNFVGGKDQVISYLTGNGTTSTGTWTVSKDEKTDSVFFPSALVINNPFVVTKGTITGNPTLAGSVTLTADAIFDPNYKVKFAAPSGTQNITSGGATLANVEFNSGAAEYLKDPMTVSGNVTATASGSTAMGIYSFGSPTTPYKMTIGGDLSLGGTVTLNWGLNNASNITTDLNGNLSMTNSNAVIYANMNFVGGKDQTINKANGAISYGTWTVAKDAGTKVKLLSDLLTFNRPLTVTSGAFDLGGKTLSTNTTVTNAAGGVIQGYGTLNWTTSNTFTQNGRVVADGGGSENTLAITGLNYTNFVAAENTSNHGWFAQNKGMLTLPGVTVAAGSPTVNWSETTGDVLPIDLVNSARIAFTGIPTGGTTLSGSLLASDRSEVTALGVPQVNMKNLKAIDVWNLTLGKSFTTAIGTFRYDDAMASALHMDESQLLIYHYSGGWSNITNTINTPTHTLLANSVNQAAGLGIFAVFGGAQANTSIWDVPGGNWATSANWWDQIPNNDRAAYINNAGTATVNTGDTANYNTLVIGESSGQSGTLNIAGGSLSGISGMSIGPGGTGTVTQSGGTNTIGSGGSGTLTIGNGTYNLNDGDLTLANIANASGTGTLNINGGTLNLTSSNINVDNLTLGDTLGSNGTLAMTSGETLTVASSMIVGNQGTGTFTDTGATINGAANLTIRNNASGAGTFSGNGTVGFTGTLTNNGKVIADGGVSPQTLSFAGMSGVYNTIDNPITGGTNGWFAVDKGKLTLPALTVLTGNPTVFWGDSLPSSGTLNDMVNSIRFVFSGVTTQGTLDAALLATDRSDIYPSTTTPIGYWKITPTGLVFSSAELAFRYDDALAQTLGYDESKLSIFRYTGGGWVDMTTSRDPANNILYASGVTGFSEWKAGEAGGGVIPEPATVISFLLGGAGLAAKRFIRRKRR